jgi:hypothetical protein
MTPSIISVEPNDVETDVVLGQSIIITFNEVIDTTTLNADTFALNYNPPTQILTSNQLIDGCPVGSIVSVEGTWTFTTNNSSQTVAVYQPTEPFKQNTVYTVTVFGTDASLSTQNVMDLEGNSISVSYQWMFTTGSLSFTTPPAQCPLVDIPAINPECIRVTPRHQIGDNLSNEIDIIFPGPIDLTSFSMTDLQMSISAVLHDPNIFIPQNLTYTPTVLSGSPNILRITITGFDS